METGRSMTDEELEAIEKRADRERLVVEVLIAEVRRLREGIKRLR